MILSTAKNFDKIGDDIYYLIVVEADSLDLEEIADALYGTGVELRIDGTSSFYREKDGIFNSVNSLNKVCGVNIAKRINSDELVTDYCQVLCINPKYLDSIDELKLKLKVDKIYQGEGTLENDFFGK